MTSQSELTKTIAIVGVTGIQGSSVAHHFLSLPNWHVRGLTRNTTSSSALALSSSGVELITANLDDPATLLPAFRGAHVIYSNTDFFALTKYPDLPDILSTKYSGMTLVDACYQHGITQGQNTITTISKLSQSPENTLETFILSTLSNVSHLTDGKLKNILHFDSKAEIESYLRNSHPFLASKTQYLQIGFYMSNILYPFLTPTKPNPSSYEYNFTWPILPLTTYLPTINPSSPYSLGPFLNYLLSPSTPAQTILLAYTDLLPISSIIATWTSVTGHKAKLLTLEAEEAESKIDTVIPGFGKLLVEGMVYYKDYGFTGGDERVKMPGDVGIDLSVLGEEGTFRKYMEGVEWDKVLKM